MTRVELNQTDVEDIIGGGLPAVLKDKCCIVPIDLITHPMDASLLHSTARQNGVSLDKRIQSSPRPAHGRALG